MLDLLFLNLKAAVQDISNRINVPHLDVKSLRSIPNEINFKVESERDFTTLYTSELPGLVIGIKGGQNPVEVINEALLIYYGIPRYWIKKIKPNGRLQDERGKTIAEQYNDSDFLSYRFN